MDRLRKYETTHMIRDSAYKQKYTISLIYEISYTLLHVFH